MRKLSTTLIAAIITAWMAYLSWPVTADVSPTRERTPISRAKTTVDNFEIYEAYEPKSCDPAA